MLVSTSTEVDGLRMHARASRGSPASKALVFVHGVGVSGRYMVPTARKLEAQLAVYLPDLPGFGHSEKPPRALGLGELGHVLGRWLETAGVRTPASLLGNSFGCQIAVELALRRPDLVDRMILAGPTVDPGGRTLLRQLSLLLLDAVREPPLLVPLQLREYVRSGIVRTLRTTRCMLDDRIEQKLPHVRAPTLIVRGGRDPIVPQRWAEQAVALLPQGQLAVIPEGAHALPYDAPRQLASIVRSFLAADAG